MVNLELQKEELNWLRDLVYQQSLYYEHHGLDSKFIFTESERWQINERINSLYRKINKAIDDENENEKMKRRSGIVKNG